jgi:hypothetical protein
MKHHLSSFLLFLFKKSLFFDFLRRAAEIKKERGFSWDKEKGCLFF